MGLVSVEFPKFRHRSLVKEGVRTSTFDSKKSYTPLPPPSEHHQTCDDCRPHGSTPPARRLTSLRGSRGKATAIHPDPRSSHASCGADDRAGDQPRWQEQRDLHVRTHSTADEPSGTDGERATIVGCDTTTDVQHRPVRARSPSPAYRRDRSGARWHPASSSSPSPITLTRAPCQAERFTGISCWLVRIYQRGRWRADHQLNPIVEVLAADQHCRPSPTRVPARLRSARPRYLPRIAWSPRCASCVRVATGVQPSNRMAPTMDIARSAVLPQGRQSRTARLHLAQARVPRPPGRSTRDTTRTDPVVPRRWRNIGQRDRGRHGALRPEARRPCRMHCMDGRSPRRPSG
jgi:hypothetical protein